MNEEKNVPVTIRRGVSLGGGEDVYPGAKILVTARQAVWLLQGENPFAVAGFETVREPGPDGSGGQNPDGGDGQGDATKGKGKAKE